MILFIKIKTESVISINSKERFLQTICEPSICPPGHGYCKGNKCICLDGYISVMDKKNHKYCNYEQKHMMTALLLESFGFIGFGHLFTGRVFAGILKLIVFYVIICYGSQFVIQFMKGDNDTERAYYVKLIISASCMCLPVIWHLIDLYRFATNQYLDGNGQPMKNW